MLILNKKSQEVQVDDVFVLIQNSDRVLRGFLRKWRNLIKTFSQDGRVNRTIRKEGGSILDILDEMIKVGQLWALPWMDAPRIWRRSLDRMEVMKCSDELFYP
ncbi:hypothetical protein Tco_0691662 [Tanacetum coccineum]